MGNESRDQQESGNKKYRSSRSGGYHSNNNNSNHGNNFSEGGSSSSSNNNNKGGDRGRDTSRRGGDDNSLRSQGSSSLRNRDNSQNEQSSQSLRSYNERDRERDSDRNDRSERSERSDRQDRNDRSERSDRSDRSDRQERQERSERSERSERQDRSDRSERSDKSERYERNERSERAEKPDRAERGTTNERQERTTERPERAERTEKPERQERQHYQNQHGSGQNQQGQQQQQQQQNNQQFHKQNQHYNQQQQQLHQLQQQQQQQQQQMMPQFQQNFPQMSNQQQQQQQAQKMNFMNMQETMMMMMMNGNPNMMQQNQMQQQQMMMNHAMLMQQQQQQQFESNIAQIGGKVRNDFLEFPPSNQQEFRAILLDYLVSDLFDYPMHSAELFESIIEAFSDIRDSSFWLRKLQLTPLLEELSEKKAIKLEECAVGTKLYDFIVDINSDKIKQLSREFSKDRPKFMPIMDKKMVAQPAGKPAVTSSTTQAKQISKREIEDLLKKETGLQKEVIFQSKEKSNLLNKYSAAEEAALASFRKQGTRRIDYCDCGTREKCQQTKNLSTPCSRAHFKKLIRPHTDENLGNCSYLDTCRHMDYCKFVHYELDVEMSMQNDQHLDSADKKLPPQWINCDLRYIDFNILGKFNVIMADPPWDIHMTLPYGTLKDKEMKSMRVDMLSDEGCIFLWVTGRAMELGRECLANWGYKQVEEIIWVKTNQLQRIIRTGRTGHWLNHSKEHCLVGIKGNPKINKKIDCDVIVSEVRETSRKPDEIYNLIERMHPGGRKIELFGRPHNTMPGWMTLGNQLPGIYLEEEDTIERYRDAYPDQGVTKELMEKNMIRMKNENDIEHIYNSHIQSVPPFKTKTVSQKESLSTPNPMPLPLPLPLPLQALKLQHSSSQGAPLSLVAQSSGPSIAVANPTINPQDFIFNGPTSSFDQE